MVIFGWMEMTWYMRTSTYREKARDYVAAARALGASSPRILVPAHPAELGVDHRHVHPVLDCERRNGADGARLPRLRLAAADPELGRSAGAGHRNLQYPWIVTSVVVAMTAVLLMVAYIGEAIREAFDPKQFTYYE